MIIEKNNNQKSHKLSLIVDVLCKFIALLYLLQ